MMAMKQLFLVILLTTAVLLIRTGYKLYAKQIKVDLEIGKRLFCHHVGAMLL